jgi:DNA-binding beta-propeller fold protein YncE
MRFSKDGKFIKAWGKRGSGPGEFDTPHSIAIDSRGRIFVADRSNSRIQIFDQDGKFIDQWKQFGRPSGIYIDRNDNMVVADSQSNSKQNPGYKRGIYVGSARDGKVTALIPFVEPDRRKTTTPASRRGDRCEGQRLRRRSQHRDVEEVRQGGWRDDNAITADANEDLLPPRVTT